MMAGQTISDRFLAARHSIAGQGLAKAVCKATTEEMIGPKKKHLDYLIHCTNEPNVSIPQMATLLIERSQNTNWVVVYKSLITTHHLMCYGNERFTQYMASSNSTFQLSNFLDKSGVQGVLGAKTGYDMSPFIRRYSRYLNEKAISYRTVAFDFCKVKRGKDDGLLRTMGADRLLKTLPALQCQLDALLEFDCSPNDLTNSVINVCFMLLFRDLIRLFACYNDAIINLLEKYFDMNKKQCREALDLYKKFLIRMDRVGEFLRVAENIGIDKGDIPDLTKAPSSLLDALEQHLQSIDGKKGSTATTPTQSASHAKHVKSGMTMLSSTSNAFGTAASNSQTDAMNGIAAAEIDEALRQRVLAEEEAAMNQYRSKVHSPSATSTSSSSNVINNPFLTPPGSDKISPSSIAVDYFANVPAPVRASDDLLQLSNPFADAFTAQHHPSVASPPQANILLQQQQQQQQLQQNLWLNNGFIAQHQMNQQQTVNANSFVSDSNFSTVFGNPEQGSFDSLGNVLQPAGTTAGATKTMNNVSQNSAASAAAAATNNGTSGVLTGDLESSLASLAENLSINSRPAQPKGVPWTSPGKVGTNWSPQPMAATNGAGYRPMGQGMATTPVPTMPPSPFQPHINLTVVRPMAGVGMVPTAVGMNMAGYPQMAQMPQTGMAPNVLSTQMPQQQQSLLFH